MKKIILSIIKKTLALFILGVLYCCDSASVGDCFQAAGDSVSMIMEVPPFVRVRSEGEVTLFIQQGDVQQVSLTTTENLLTDVSVYVFDDTLIVRDTNACNFVRDYGLTVVTITTPNLTHIRNSSNYDIISIGTLAFPELTLTSNTNPGRSEAVHLQKLVQRVRRWAAWSCMVPARPWVTRLRWVRCEWCCWRAAVQSKC